MTKCQSSASSITVPSTFVIHLMNGAQILNAARVTLCPKIFMLLFIKTKPSL